MTLEKAASAVNLATFLLGVLLACTLLGGHLHHYEPHTGFVLTLCAAILFGYVTYIVLAVRLFLRKEDRS